MATHNKFFKVSGLNLQPEWHVLDAKDQTLGRLSTEVAILLQGKHRPTYVPYLNTGDFVVVINAEKIKVTGNKLKQKMYYRHSGYHGGLTEETLENLLDRTPIRALKHAVKGMLPKTTVGKNMLSRLKLYAGDSHPHAAQINARLKTDVAKGEPRSPQTSDVSTSVNANSIHEVANSEASVADSGVTAKPKSRKRSVSSKDKEALETKTKVKTKAKAKVSSPAAKAKPKSRKRTGVSDADTKTQNSPEEK